MFGAVGLGAVVIDLQAVGDAKRVRHMSCQAIARAVFGLLRRFVLGLRRLKVGEIQAEGD